MTLPTWNELDVNVRRSDRKLYNIIAREYNLPSWDQLDVNTRRSKEKLYNYIARNVGLPEWDDLPVNTRRSGEGLYEQIRNQEPPSRLPLTVMVYDYDNNTLVQGATVTIGDYVWFTDENGEAMFPELDYELYYGRIEKEGYEPATNEPFLYNKTHNRFRVDIHRISTKGDLTIVVLDENEPVSNATVNIGYGDRNTDNEGKVVFENIDYDGYTVYVTKDGYSSVVDNIEFTKDYKTHTINLTPISTKGDLTIFVLDNEDSPLAEATVNIGYGDRYTDEEGKVTFENLDYDGYTVYVTKEGYESATDNIEFTESSNTHTINLTPISTKGDLAILVLDGETPLADATVNIGSDDRITDNMGKVLFENIEYGEYTVYVTKEDYSPVVDNIDFTKDYNTHIVHLEPINKGDLSITVKDTESVVLENATIDLENVSGRDPLVTDENGNVVFSDLEYGQYVVNVDKNGYTAQETITFDKTHTTFDITVDMTRGDLILEVIDGDTDDPVSDVKVSITGKDPIYTDGDGKAVFTGLEHGMYNVTFEKDQYYPFSEEINHRSRETLHGVTLSRNSGRLICVVVDEDSNPLNEAMVMIQDTDRDEPTDEWGEANFYDLEFGTYNITASKKNYQTETKSVLFNEDEESVSFILTEVSGDLKVVVNNDNIVPPVTLPNAKVTLDGVSQMTDNNGETTFKNIPFGEHTLKIEKDDHQTIDETITMDKNHKAFEYTMIQNSSDLNINIRDEDNAGVDGATVALDDGRSVETVSGGNVVFTHTLFGEHTITVEKEGYKTLQETFTLDKEHHTFVFTIQLVPEPTAVLNFLWDSSKSASISAKKLTLSEGATATVDWGDGTTEEYVSGTNLTHTYAEAGAMYDVKVNVYDGQITALGNECFKSASGLISIDIPEGVTSLGTNCFNRCTNMDGITMPSSLVTIGASCFLYCAALESIVIPENVEVLNGSTFDTCIKLSDIVLPNGLTSIGNSCFNKCSELTRIFIPNNVTTIGSSCFNYCTKLNDVHLPSELTSLGNNCFDHCSSLFEIQIPSGVIAIPNRCFSVCSGLTSVQWGWSSSVRNINPYAFYGCSSLEEIYIPETVVGIDNNAFEKCYDLKALNIPAAVTSIGTNILLDCPYLENVDFYWGLASTIIPYNSEWNISTSAKFNIPKGYKQNYIGKGYPTSQLVERT